VTARVAEAGIPPCDAGNSAANPSWCLSESGWRQRFSAWINDSLPDDLLQVNIFFDLRTLVGDEELTERLRHHIFSEVTARPIFLYYLAESTINFRLPADPLGRLRAEGPDGNVLNLKKVMLHFVSFVRIYALRHRLEETNTITRLETLAAGNLLPRDLAEETLAAWRYLLESRFQAQMTAAAGGFSDHNLLFLDQLGHWEQTLVKMAAGHIANLQRRLSKDFTRAA
jgi:CBS domain-containing protein